MSDSRSRPPTRSILTPARGARRPRSAGERLAEAHHVSGVGSYELDLTTGALHWTDESFRIHGMASGSFEPDLESVLGLTHPEDAARVRKEYHRLLAQPKTAMRVEYRIIRPDGEERTVAAGGAALLDWQGEPERIAGSVQDVTELRRAERDLERSEQRQSALIDQIPGIVYTAGTGEKGTWEFVSGQVEDMLGYSPQEWLVDPTLWFDRVHPEDRGRVLQDEQEIAEGGRLRSEYRIRARDGRVIWVRDDATKIRREDGTEIFQGVILDVTEARRDAAAVAEKHGQLQAIIDNSPLMIFVKDRDHRFTLANGAFEDVFGRGPGEIVGLTDADLLPQEEAARLRAIDEAVMATGARRELEESVQDPRRGPRTIFTQKFPLRDADGAIYGMCAVLADVTDRKHSEGALVEKVEWAARIREAVAGDLFTLRAQPIIDLESRDVVQEELLIRMTGDDGRLIMPGEFLPPAERFGLAPKIDRWVISKAARLATERRVEVNLSAQSMSDPTLPGYIEAELRAAGADPANVVFEITETAAAEDLEQACRLADRVVALGCGFALDDFGTGFGSFTYLRHLPVSYIKIDIAFVRNLTEDASDHQVVSAIVDVARNVGIETIAEGVESAGVLELLGEMGVDFAQGFHIGRPAPVEPVTP